jgi:hypothetical protein
VSRPGVKIHYNRVIHQFLANRAIGYGLTREGDFYFTYDEDEVRWQYELQQLDWLVDRIQFWVGRYGAQQKHYFDLVVELNQRWPDLRGIYQ